MANTSTKKGGGGKKIGRNAKKYAGQSHRTAANKLNRIRRAEKLKSRPDHAVSRNCRKKREERKRLRDYKEARARCKTKKDWERLGPSPTERGEKQFRERITAS